MVTNVINGSPRDKYYSPAFSGNWDLVVLDEINDPIGYKMLLLEKAAQVIRQKAGMVPVILTGRNAQPHLDRACRHRHRDARGQARLPGKASSPGVESSSDQNKGVRIKRTPKVAENVFCLEDMASVAKGY